MPAPNPIDKPETPPRVREKLVQGELLYHQLAEKVGGMADAQGEIKTDVRELRKQMRDHERLNAERSQAREESEREMRGEISALRESTAKSFGEVDKRLDDLTGMVRVLVDRQPQATPVEAQQTPGPITAALGLPARQPRTGSTAAVAGGGLGLAGVLTLVGQVASLPVVVQWALGVGVVVCILTACYVVAVRMTRRD